MLHEQGTIALPDTLPKMKPSTLALFYHLLRHQKTARSNSFKAGTRELLKASGLSDKTLKTARDELKMQGLIVAEDTGKKGMWTYELRNPATGAAMPNPRGRVKFADLSDSAVLAFYRRIGFEVRHGAIDCPACKREGQALITLNRGDEEHGRWSCGKCDKFGGLIHAYLRVYPMGWPQATIGTNALLQEIDSEAYPARPAKPAYVTHPPVVEQWPVEPGEVVTP
jgi:hypothetical protein